MKTTIHKLSTVLFIVLANLLITSSIFAQLIPDNFSYQAVIRDANDSLLINQSVSINISILGGSPTGGCSFSETHTTTTNEKGLISIEIGGGTPVHNTIDNLHWSMPLFLKTEVDPTGGTNYTITAISQMLSVPYAVNAKRALTADIAEVAHIAENVILYIAGTGINITNDVINAQTYAMGDFAQGGIVFWVDGTGQHGLVCAKTDQSSDIRWYAGTMGYTRAHGDGPFSGEMNTAIIISSQVAIGDDGNTYIAYLCNELQITEGGKTYGDWYLPSKEELNLMYLNKAAINATATANGGNAFSSDFYWSSTECNTDPDRAWAQSLYNGSQGIDYKYDWISARAIRSF